MKVTQAYIRKLVQEEVSKMTPGDESGPLSGRKLSEAASDTILFKVKFKPEYKLDDSSNTPLKPIFVQMTKAERRKLAIYAAIDTISGYGSNTFDRLSSREKLGSSEMSFPEILKLVKSLYRIRFHR